jgi:hypothetical protein
MQKKREKKIEHFLERKKREREQLMDVKENNLRSKESLMRDDRQQEKRDKVASHTYFFSFFTICNQSVKRL